MTELTNLIQEHRKKLTQLDRVLEKKKEEEDALITSNNNKQNAVELETTIDAITITSEPDQKYFYYVNNFENPLNEMSQGVSSGKSRTEIPLGR